MITTARTLLAIALILAIALRTATLLGVFGGFLWISGTGDSTDANIGAGLLAFAALMLICGLGGLIDGWRLPYARVVLIWIVAALLTTVGMSALADYPSAAFDMEVFLSDLRDTGVFLVGILLIPALLGGGLTHLVNPDRNGSRVEVPHEPTS